MVVCAAWDIPASCEYSDCAAALTARGRGGLSTTSGASSGQEVVPDPKVEGGGRADRTGPVDDFRAIRRHDHVAGVEVGMARGDVLRNNAA